ncbi:AbrB/MazE/SpoVT family DNA-binding domain-containing protein [Candidatus Woesearchaeota archaeon]|nr:AbrB/MazE/SpoVT family DNA-binding domain-containing protein [Candidatus Woesearchaeota archaeon]
MDVAITKMSTKGQVVIPLEMRECFKKGEKLLILKKGENIIMKKASNLDKQLIEDLEFARRTEEAIKRYKKGEFKAVDSKAFLKELEKW